MALVARLMHEDTDERSIAVHQFVAALKRVNSGKWTPAQIKAFYAMTTADAAEFDFLVGKLAAIADSGDRLDMLAEIEAIFILAESKTVPDHITVSDVGRKKDL